MAHPARIEDNWSKLEHAGLIYWIGKGVNVDTATRYNCRRFDKLWSLTEVQIRIDQKMQPKLWDNVKKRWNQDAIKQEIKRLVGGDKSRVDGFLASLEQSASYTRQIEVSSKSIVSVFPGR